MNSKSIELLIFASFFINVILYIMFLDALLSVALKSLGLSNESIYAIKISDYN